MICPLQQKFVGDVWSRHIPLLFIYDTANYSLSIIQDTVVYDGWLSLKELHTRATLWPHHNKITKRGVHGYWIITITPHFRSFRSRRREEVTPQRPRIVTNVTHRTAKWTASVTKKQFQTFRTIHKLGRDGAWCHGPRHRGINLLQLNINSESTWYI